MVSGADLSAKQGYAAKISSATWVLGTENAGVGIIIDGGTASGDHVTVGFGHVKALAAAAIAVGDLISVEATNGRIQTAASGDTPIGRALGVAGAANDVVECFIYGAVDESVA
jgi:hypothetical protein